MIAPTLSYFTQMIMVTLTYPARVLLMIFVLLTLMPLLGLEFWQGMVTARHRNVFRHVRVYWLASSSPALVWRVTGTHSTDSTPN